jgi:hypothetical protein
MKTVGPICSEWMNEVTRSDPAVHALKSISIGRTMRSETEDFIERTEIRTECAGTVGDIIQRGGGPGKSDI